VLLAHSQRPIVKDFVTNRLKKIALVGNPAPVLQGPDADGKPVDLASLKGKVVLVVFWATWCPPCVEEVEFLQQVAAEYKSRGFQVVGVNLDRLQDDGRKGDLVRSDVRRFLIDHNVTWPTLISAPGEKDYAKPFGVTELPANALIARDGT